MFLTVYILEIFLRTFPSHKRERTLYISRQCLSLIPEICVHLFPRLLVRYFVHTTRCFLRTNPREMIGKLPIPWWSLRLSSVMFVSICNLLQSNSIAIGFFFFQRKHLKYEHTSLFARWLPPFSHDSYVWFSGTLLTWESLYCRKTPLYTTLYYQLIDWLRRRAVEITKPFPALLVKVFRWFSLKRLDMSRIFFYL